MIKKIGQKNGRSLIYLKEIGLHKPALVTLRGLCKTDLIDQSLHFRKFEILTYT